MAQVPGTVTLDLTETSFCTLFESVIKDILINLSSCNANSSINLSENQECFAYEDTEPVQGNANGKSSSIKFYYQLLSEDLTFVSTDTFPSSNAIDMKLNKHCCLNRNVLNYPQHPLYKALTDSLIKWIVFGKSPIISLPTIHLLKEEHSRVTREVLTDKLNSIIKEIKHMISQNTSKFSPCLCTASSMEEQNSDTDSTYYADYKVIENVKLIRQFLSQKLVKILLILEEVGVLYLLGVRQTAGSIICLPPPLPALTKSFNELHHEKSKLTVGARALAKHSHRSMEKWWGVCTGSEEEKNKQANFILHKIINDITWLNIHSLPHEVHVVELRTSEGFGVRWSSDGKHFRGFLEPQMEDGHSKMWKH